MTLQGGDRKFGHGDELTVRNASGGPLEPGDVVAVTGDGGDHPEVGPAGTAGNEHGVVGAPAADGELTEITLRGAVVAKVDGGVVAGTELVAAGSGGTDGAGSAGVLGEGSSGGAGVYALTDEEGGLAVVHLK